MEQLLNELVSRLKEAYGEGLLSVILYGSGAVTDHHSKYSNLNVLCVLRQVGLPELRQAEKAMRWWLKQKQPAPLFVSADEVRCSDDVFPIEYLDIQQNHRVLHGEDIYASIRVDRSNHRRQVEHELSSNLLRLRQRYLVLHPSDKDIAQLMVDSISSFATLARHALILANGDSGEPHVIPAKKREIFDVAAKQFGLDAVPFHTVLAIREGIAKPSGDEVHALFASYLDQIAKLEEVVDQI